MSDLLRRSLGETDRRSKPCSGAGLWTVEVDSTELESALLNLAINARDAMPDGGKLTIETSQRLSRRRLLPPARRSHAGPICAGRRVGHRHRHVARDARARVRAVLHHQGNRQGHRPGPEPGLWLRQAVRRACEDLQRAGPGHDLKLYLPRHDGEEAAMPPQRGQPARSAGAARPS